MKYVCLVYHSLADLEAIPDAELEAAIAKCGIWVSDLERGGHHVFSSGLQSPNLAKTLRKADGKLSVMDGPFAETKEVLAGFTIIEARDIEEALELASGCPGALGTLEVRPAMCPDIELTDPLDQKIAAAIRRSAHETAPA